MLNDETVSELSEEQLGEMRKQVIDWIAREEAAVKQRKEQAAARATSKLIKRSAPKPKATPRSKPIPAAPPPTPTPAAPAAPAISSVPVPKKIFARPVPPEPIRRAALPAKPPSVTPLVASSWPKPAAVSKSPKARRTTPSLRVLLSRVSLGLLMVFVVGVVVGPAIAMYGFGATGRWVQFASRVVPFPAAYVNAKLVRYSDYLADLAALRHYQLATSLAATAATNREQVMRKLITDAVVEQLALGQKISVTSAHVQQYLNGLAAELGGEQALTRRLRADYDMDPQQFARRVVAPHLLREQLVAVASARPDVQAAALEGARRLREQLISGEITFDEAASRYSQDVVARVGGDLGYVPLDELDDVLGPEGAAVVRGLAIGALSDVLESPEGMLLYQVTERLAGEPGDTDQLRISRLVLKPQVSVDALVHDALAKARVVQFVR